jgi:hypothetical protein
LDILYLGHDSVRVAEEERRHEVLWVLTMPFLILVSSSVLENRRIIQMIVDIVFCLKIAPACILSDLLRAG